MRLVGFAKGSNAFISSRFMFISESLGNIEKNPLFVFISMLTNQHFIDIYSIFITLSICLNFLINRKKICSTLTYLFLILLFMHMQNSKVHIHVGTRNNQSRTC